MADSEITWLIAIVAILALFSFVCTAYSQTYVDFPAERWYGPHNYTITQTFTDNVTASDINKKDVWGKWAVDSTNGLYPYTFIDRAWLPLSSEYWARVQFGTVRNINNTFTEKYYLNNINRASGDMVKILMSSRSSAITSPSINTVETYLVIDGTKVYVEVDSLELGWTFPGAVDICDKGYTLPAGVTGGNISYRAVFLSGGLTDPATAAIGNNVNTKCDYYVYWEGQLAFIVDNTEIMQTSSAVYERQADIQTNIGGEGQGYYLQILSHYEDVGVRVVSSTVGADVTGYDDALSWMTTLLGVLTWGIPFDVGIPSIILFLFIGLPEMALGYIIVRLGRGGG